MTATGPRQQQQLAPIQEPITLERWFNEEARALLDYNLVFENSDEKDIQTRILTRRIGIWLKCMRDKGQDVFSVPIRVLDIGCGPGTLTLKLLSAIREMSQGRVRFEVVLVDSSDMSLNSFQDLRLHNAKYLAAVESVEPMRGHWPRDTADLRGLQEDSEGLDKREEAEGDLRRLEEMEEHFDIVLADHSLYNIGDEALFGFGHSVDAINQALRLLRPNGLLVASLMSLTSDVHRIRLAGNVAERQGLTSEDFTDALVAKGLFYERHRYESKLRLSMDEEALRALQAFVFVGSEKDASGENRESRQALIDQFARKPAVEGESLRWLRNRADIFVLERSPRRSELGLTARTARNRLLALLRSKTRPSLFGSRDPVQAEKDRSDIQRFLDSVDVTVEEVYERLCSEEPDSESRWHHHEFEFFLLHAGVLESSAGYRDPRGTYHSFQSRSEDNYRDYLVVQLVLPSGEGSKEALAAYYRDPARLAHIDDEALRDRVLKGTLQLQSRNVDGHRDSGDRFKLQACLFDGIAKSANQEQKALGSYLRDGSEFERKHGLTFTESAERTLDCLVDGFPPAEQMDRAFLLEHGMLHRSAPAGYFPAEELRDLLNYIAGLVDLNRQSNEDDLDERFTDEGRRKFSDQLRQDPAAVRSLVELARVANELAIAPPTADSVERVCWLFKRLQHLIKNGQYRFGVLPKTVRLASNGLDESFSTLSFPLDERSRAFATLWGGPRAMGPNPETAPGDSFKRPPRQDEDLRDRLYAITDVLGEVYRWNVSQAWERIDKNRQEAEMGGWAAHAMRGITGTLVHQLERVQSGPNLTSVEKEECALAIEWTRRLETSLALFDVLGKLETGRAAAAAEISEELAPRPTSVEALLKLAIQQEESLRNLTSRHFAVGKESATYNWLKLSHAAMSKHIHTDSSVFLGIKTKQQDAALAQLSVRVSPVVAAVVFFELLLNAYRNAAEPLVGHEPVLNGYWTIRSKNLHLEWTALQRNSEEALIYIETWKEAAGTKPLIETQLTTKSLRHLINLMRHILHWTWEEPRIDPTNAFRLVNIITIPTGEDIL